MIEEKRCIVQFTHPGEEHYPDKGKEYISWNIGKHKRKFMLAKGDFVMNEKIVKDEFLLFWGEWEPDSKIIKRFDNSLRGYPKYIQTPFLQYFPDHKRENTDPFIFSEEFYYFCCKQTKKDNQITQMSKLANGSIILFGSTINQGKSDAYFALDTVFVVKNFIEYSSTNYEESLKDKVSDDFFNVSVKSLYHSFNNNRCYIGASFNNKFEDMYSFVPSKKYENINIGFERVKLTNKDFDFISNNLNSAPKLNRELILCKNDFYDIWIKLRIIIKNQGFIEGVKFSFTKQS